MIPHDALSAEIAKRINARIQALTEDLVRGGPADMPSYSKQVGTIRGLMQALEDLGEARKTLHIQEDDEP